VWLAVTSICFDISLLELLWTLTRGFEVVVQQEQDSQHLAHLLASSQVTHLQCTPSLLRLLMPTAQQMQPLGQLRQLLLGGEALPLSLAQALGQVLTGSLHNMYGPTETTIWSACAHLPASPQRIELGQPLANTQLYVVDQHAQQVPPGVAGELLIGGAGLARGYLGRAELTAERFVPDGFSGQAGARLYRTGDLARCRSDGSLEYLGRLDQQVKLHGHRIELGEIESVLSQHPQVQQAALALRQQQETSASPQGQRLVAYVVPSPASEPASASDLRAWLLERLPDYMLPSLFVPLEALPLTPNGKLDRQALPAPEAALLVGEREVVAPRTATEQTLAQVWAQVLAVEQVSLHDNFFTLGGDSILSIHLVSRLKQVGIHITPKVLFQRPTIAELASFITTTENAYESEAEQGMVTGSVPLTPTQHWFFEQQQSALHLCTQARLLVTHKSLDVHALKQALAYLCIQHDALRLRFITTAEGWQQRHTEEVDEELLTVIDLSAVPAEEQDQAIKTVADEVQTGFNLQTGPLLQAVFFKLGTAQAEKLLIVIHRLVIDDISWNILLGDLQTIYEQLSNNQNIQLTAKTTSFQRWARQLTAYAASQEIRKELSYWLALAQQPIAHIPVDQGENTEDSVNTVEVSLSAEETHALLYEVPQAYQTQMNDVLLTALTQTLTRWTGQHYHMVHLESDGRKDIVKGMDLSHTVGWFSSFYPVVLETDTNARPGKAIKLTKEHLHHIPQDGIGYSVLRYLATHTAWAQSEEKAEELLRLSALPTPEVSFHYRSSSDDTSPETSLFSAIEGIERHNSSLGKRQHMLEIEGSIRAGQLHLNWMYSHNLHQQETIETLTNNYLEALRALIAHCQAREADSNSSANFPKAKLSQTNLDKLVAKINKKRMK